jgi:thioredoxin-related protein
MCFKRSFYIVFGMLMLSSIPLKAQQVSAGQMSLKEAVTALEEGQFIILFFEADWCGYCKQMRREVFPDPKVMVGMKDRFTLIHIDIESNEEVYFQGEYIKMKELARRSEMQETPTMIFINHQEEKVASFSGFIDKDGFIRLMNFMETGAYLSQDFEDYEGK